MKTTAFLPISSPCKVFTAILEDMSFTDGDCESEQEFRDYCSQAFPDEPIIKVIEHESKYTEDGFRVYEIQTEDLK